MKTPLQVIFKGMDPTERLHTRIESEMQKLEDRFGRMTDCRVTVEAPDQHSRQGGLFNVHIHASLPGRKDIDVSRDPPANHAHEDPSVALRDAFRAAWKQLERHAGKIDPVLHPHAQPPIGTVVRLFLAEGYGFLQTADGREVYFHENSVLNGAFGKLEVGAQVRFAEEPGEKGPQASTVAVAGKHGMR